jgi:hypothetical protein
MEAPFHVEYHRGNASYDGVLAMLATGRYTFAASCFTRTVAREIGVVDFSWSSFTGAGPDVTS